MAPKFDLKKLAKEKRKAEQAKKIEKVQPRGDEPRKRPRSSISIAEPSRRQRVELDTATFVPVGESSLPKPTPVEVPSGPAPTVVDESDRMPISTLRQKAPIQENPAFVPRIQVLNLETPDGRPFTIHDSAVQHPKEFLDGVFSPRDRQDVRRKRTGDLAKVMLESTVTTTLYSLELAQRAQDLDLKLRQDEGELRSLKEKMRMMEKEKKQAEEESRQSKAKAEAGEKRLAEKDEEVIQKLLLISECNAELRRAVSEQERLQAEVNKSLEDNSSLREDIIKQGRELSKEIADKDQALKEAKDEFEKNQADLVQDFVSQIEDARNEYFLDGWEASMTKMNVDPSSSTYRDVPFPNPESAIPLFSFDRPQELSGEDGSGISDKEGEEDQTAEKEKSPEQEGLNDTPEDQE